MLTFIFKLSSHTFFLTVNVVVDEHSNAHLNWPIAFEISALYLDKELVIAIQTGFLWSQYFSEILDRGKTTTPLPVSTMT